MEKERTVFGSKSDELQPSLRDALKEEFKRRYAINQLRKKLYATSKEWWWAVDESLDSIGEQLSASNHCVIDSFLGEEGFAQVRRDVIDAKDGGLINEDGRLNGGREGNATLASVDKEYRSDHLGWFNCSALPGSGSLACNFLDNEGLNKVEGENEEWKGLQYLLQRLETIVAELRPKVEDLRDCSSRTKAMVTCYPKDKGLGYRKHYDNANKNGRRLTLIYYVGNVDNELYNKSICKGELRIYDQEPKQTYVDVEPVADRLVLFYSDMRCPHEVLPVCSYDRYAVTVWFFDSVEKRAAVVAATVSD